MNRDNIEKKLREVGKKSNLSQSVKDQKKEELLAFMKMYPVREVSLDRHSSRSEASSSLPLLGLRKFRLMHAVIIAAIVLSGATSVSAEQALPGDLLYGVKTSVNENVRGALAVGAQAEGKWQAELAARRLNELAELKSEGEVDSETEAELTAQAQSHAKEARDEAKALQSRGKIEAAMSVLNSLEVALNSSPQGDAQGQSNSNINTVIELELDLLNSVEQELEQERLVELDSETEQGSSVEINVGGKNGLEIGVKSETEASNGDNVSGMNDEMESHDSGDQEQTAESDSGTSSDKESSSRGGVNIEGEASGRSSSEGTGVDMEINMSGQVSY